MEMSFVIFVYENMYIIAHYIVMCAIRRFFFYKIFAHVK